MDEFCVMFERAQDDTVIERLEKFITQERVIAVQEVMREMYFKVLHSSTEEKGIDHDTLTHITDFCKSKNINLNEE